MALDDFEFGRTVRGISQRIAYQLGDAEPGDEFESFDQAWIQARVYDTFKWLQGRRPNLFADEVEFALKPGSRQEVPDSCDKLIEILSICRDGQTYPVQESSFEVLQQMRVYEKLMPSCAKDLCVHHAGVSEVDARSFLVSPPVAPGKPATVTATCSDMDRFFDDPDLRIDCDVAKWINTVVEYVLFQAFSMDGDNAVSSAMAEQHRTTFFDLAPVQRREAS